MNNQLMFGADPEVFATYEKDGQLMVLPPAYLRKRGAEFTIDPHKPTHPIFIERDNYLVHEDGVALELGVAPSPNWEDVFDTIQFAYNDIEKNLLGNYVPDCDGKVHVIPTVGFDVDRWAKENDEFQMCLIFGCNPDLDAFHTKYRAKIRDVRKHPFRYGGGHIHISGLNEFAEEPIMAIKCLAMTLGQAAVAYSDTPELERERTFLYGRPGKYRPQQYPDGTVGIEYRTPSNRWTSSKDIASKVFEWAKVGVDIFSNPQLSYMLVDELAEIAAKNIIETNQEEAMRVLDRIEEVI